MGHATHIKFSQGNKDVHMRLVRWPDFADCHYNDETVRIAAHLVRSRCSYDELISYFSVRENELKVFLNACHKDGILKGNFVFDEVRDIEYTMPLFTENQFATAI